MRKNSKKLIALLGTAILAMGAVAGCSSSSSGTTTAAATEAATEAASEAADSSAAEEQTEAASPVLREQPKLSLPYAAFSPYWLSYPSPSTW